MDTARRSFLRGRFASEKSPARPPWSLPESLFTQACTRCGDCIQHCETGLLQKGNAGFPEARFDLNGCNFCKKCVLACKPGALRLSVGTEPWLLKAFIGTTCLTQQKVVCRTCGERCEVGAICFPPEKGGVGRPQLDLSICNGCGMCVADCPSHAITINLSEIVEKALL